MASPENGSEQALESGKDVSCHPPTLFDIFLKRIMGNALDKILWKS